MTISQKKQFGDLGEDAAVKYLLQNNYKILGRNYQNNFGRRLGEIDIVARDTTRDEIVFVEVKTRALQKYEGTLPEENITYGKLHKLAKIANIYLRSHQLDSAPYRFDAISVWLDAIENKARIKHIISL